MLRHRPQRSGQKNLSERVLTSLECFNSYQTMKCRALKNPASSKTPLKFLSHNVNTESGRPLAFIFIDLGFRSLYSFSMLDGVPRWQIADAAKIA